MQLLKRVTLLILFLTASSGLLWGQGNLSVSGTAIDVTTGLGVENVEIIALGFNNNGDSLFYTTTTNPNGAFQIDNIIEGTYFFLAAHQSYEPENVGPVAVGPNTPAPVVNFQLVPLTGGGDASLSGSVFDSQTGALVVPARVTLSSVTPAGDSLFYVAGISANGGYIFDQVLPGSYTLSCFAPGYDLFTFENFPLSSGPNNFDIFLSSNGGGGDAFLSGVVIDSTSGQIIPFAEIILIGINSAGDSLFYHTFTNPDGSYMLDNLTPGNYLVICQAQGYEDLVIPSYQILSGSNTLNLFLIPGNVGGEATLSGYVIEADSTATGTPIPFADIVATSETNGFIFTVTTRSNQDGSYFFPNLIPGTYELIFSAQGYETLIVEDFEIVAGSNSFLAFLQGDGTFPTSSISGQVVFDDDGAPVFPAYLEFISMNGAGYSTVTDAQGNYTAALPVGEYYVACTYIDSLWWNFYIEYYDDVQNISDATLITLADSQNVTGINFGIPAINSGTITSISGTVTDNGNQPLAGAEVVIQSPIFGPVGDSLVYRGFTDDNGEYTISVESGGGFFPNIFFIASAEKQGYQIEFWNEKPSFHLADPIFFLGDTSITDINFTLDPEGNPNNSISGTLTNDTGLPLAGAFVVGSNLNSGEITFTFSDSSGGYALGGLDTAPHVLLYAADGHVPEFYDDAYVWEDALPVFANGTVSGIDASLNAISNAPTGGMVTGTVIDAGGQSLAGVFLTLHNEFGDVIGYDFTDSQGGYEIRGLVDGNFAVHATKVSYNSQAQDIDFNSASSNMILANFEMSDAPTGLEPETSVQIPQDMELAQNFPNPFNPETRIGFSIPESQQVRLTVYNILGQVVKELVNENLAAGSYKYSWNGTDQLGRKVASGIYLYSLEAGNQKLVRKMLLTK